MRVAAVMLATAVVVVFKTVSRPVMAPTMVEAFKIGAPRVRMPSICDR